MMLEGVSIEFIFPAGLTSTMITTANSLLRGCGMPNHVRDVLFHAMSGSELSRVRTELDPL